MLLNSLDKLKIDLSGKNRDSLLEYIDYLATHIANLKEKIIELFSPHNTHLTEEYMDHLINTGRILFAELNHTTKSDDYLQYLLAKEQDALEYKDILLSLPEVYSYCRTQFSLKSALDDQSIIYRAQSFLKLLLYSYIYLIQHYLVLILICMADSF